MRRMGLRIAIFFFSLNCLLAADSGGISWYKDIEQASAAAREANKPMLLDFWADWCVACWVMEKSVYAEAGVVEVVSKKFVPVQIDFDKQEKLARKYNVASLPTILFTDSYGTELFRHEGILDAEELTELLKALPGDVARINRLHQVLAEDKGNFEALEGLGRELREAGLYLRSNQYYSRALKTDPAKKEPRQREQILVAMGWNYIELRESKEAAKVFERCAKEFPNSESKPTFLLGLGQAYALADADDKARKFLNAVVSQYPDSDAARRAERILSELR